MSQLRVETNKPVGRVLKEAVDKNPLPDNITYYSSYSTDEYGVYIFENPASVHVGFILRTDQEGWVAVYADTGLDVLHWLELNLATDSFEIPAQTAMLS